MSAPLDSLNSGFLLRVAKDMVPGHTYIDKFGAVNTVTTASDPADIWSGADPALKGTIL